MFFAKIFSFAVLAATAAADTHNSCYCRFNKDYDSGLTQAACTVYNNGHYKWGSTVWSKNTGLCAAVPGASLAGDQWLQACKTAGQNMGKDMGLVTSIC